MSDKTFDQLLVEALPRLRGYAISLTGNRALADDLLQEAAMRALAARTQFTMGTNFNAWMYRILRNEFVSWMRKPSRRVVPIDQLPEALLSRAAVQENQILVRELGQALAKLPRAQREALVLICGSGLSYEEAASVLGCTVGTVKSRVFRARAQVEAFVTGIPNPHTAKRPVSDREGKKVSRQPVP
ncbi:MAG: sigma-70 family RNA polymerase sigma factor [Rhodospirillaceae bacterium]|nr:sigma-70 family RNA polymerase sigma factor [Rhodospirillaceae bacterium]